MGFDEFYINQVRDSNKIEDVVSGYVRLKKSGQNQIGLCPFHNEKTPSFNVSQSKQIFKCFGCQEGGDVIGFVRLMENLSFPDAVKYLAEKQGIPLPSEQIGTSIPTQDNSQLLSLMEVAQEYFSESLRSNSKASSYLAQRKISEETIERFGLGYAPPGNRFLRMLKLKDLPEPLALKCGLIKKSDGGQAYDNFRERITIPIRDSSGRVIAFGGRGLGQTVPKYLNSPDTVLYKKSFHLFSLDLARHEIRRRECVILVEGYFDCIVPFQAGFRNIVASLGTSLTRHQIKLLRRYTRQVVLSYDSDEAGLKAAHRCIELLMEGGLRVNVVQFPEESDPDTFINKYGSKAFREALMKSLPGIDFVLDLCIAQHRDAFGPRGKPEIVEQVSSLLKQIENRIERSEYVSRVASRLQISPELVLQQLRRFRSRKTPKLQYLAKYQIEVRPAEAILLHALMDPEMGPRLKPLVDSDLIKGLATQKIFEKLLELWEKERQPDILSLRDGMEDKPGVDLLENISLNASFQTQNETIILESIRSLKKLQLDEEKRRIRQEIKIEEKSNASSPLIDELLEKLQNVEHNRILLDQREELA